MIIITEEQKKILKDYIDELDQIIAGDNLEDLLLEIDDAIIGCIGEDDEPDEEGIKLQKIYDEIYEAN